MVLITRLRDINQCSELFKRPSYLYIFIIDDCLAMYSNCSACDIKLLSHHKKIFKNVYPIYFVLK